MSSSRVPWYRTAWAAALLLVLFPPAGVYLAWRHQGWATRAKRVATGAAVLWTAGVVSAITLAIVLGGGGEDGEQAAAGNPQEAALHELEAASDRSPDLYFQNGFPRFVHGSVEVQGADAVERARNFLQTYRELYLQSDPNLALAVRDTRGPDEDGLEHVAFYQTFRGYPVYAGEIVVSLDGDRVYATIGGLLSDVILNTFPAISPREAEDIARDDVDQPDAPIFGETGLLVFDPSLLDDVPPDPHMAWEVTLGDRDPWRVFVDAHTGDVLFKYFLEARYDLDLEDANGANAADTGCYWWTTDDDWIGDEDGMDSDYLSDQQAVKAWWYSKYVYDFYLNTFGRDSYDNGDGQIEVYVHASNAGGAMWTGASIDCDLIEFNNGWVAYDIMVHEFTHGVMDYRPISPLTYYGQSGALEESLADTFAYLADPDCGIGEDVVGGPIRSFCSPSPDRMWEYLQTQSDHGGVHTNNGIMNMAAYFLSEELAHTHPDNNVWVLGIGHQKMGKLYYAVEAGITSGYQFMDFRNSLVATADNWAGNGTHGFGSVDACRVRRAFFAVELGNDDKDCDGIEDPADPDDDNDTIIDAIDNCPLTFNPNQKDTDGDGLGDACDPDDDNDGVPDSNGGPKPPCGLFDPDCFDNCPTVPNPNQQDHDHNGSGDACDDGDKDGVLDSEDNCVGVYNPGQANVDSHLDDDGDACDPDADGDGLSVFQDNCPLVPNPDQANSDGDYAGDACDPCPDVTGETKAMGQTCFLGECTYWPIFDDADGDTIPDACDDSFSFGVSDDALVPVGPPDKFLKPDGQFVEVDVEVGPRPYAKIPLAPCPPPADQQGNTDGMDEYGYTETMPVMDGRGVVITDTHMCRNAFPQDELVLLVLGDLHPNARAWVSDDEGRSVGPRGKGDVRVLRFRPLGGRKYFLNLAFGPTLEPGQRVTFSAVMTAGPAEEQTGPTVEEPSPPHVVPPPLGSPAPDLTATATSTPRATPQPSATREEAATVTPTPTPARPEPTATAVPREPTATSTRAPLPTATAVPREPTATRTRVPLPTATAIPPEPTATPTPSRVSPPTATPTRIRVVLPSPTPPRIPPPS